MATSKQQPPWSPPPKPHHEVPNLRILNSLTRRKEPFYPLDPEGKAVSWYSCGPTVYDHAHLGHARNYMANDILRRILSNYFGYKITFCMNITDLDDKIIIRGRQRHLYAKWKQEKAGDEEGLVSGDIRGEAEEAWKAYAKKNLPLIPEDMSPATFAEAIEKDYAKVLNGEALEEGQVAGDKVAKVKMHINTARTAASALMESGILLSRFYTQTEDVLLPYLDSLYGSEMDGSDHAPFLSLTQDMEKSFFDDMHALNVLDPDRLIRVTEVVPDIVAFIQKIIDNGFAYTTSDGSVYFDINAFEQAGHPYARLEPWSKGDRALVADGEGSLSTAKPGNKKSDSDFALWKSSKPGEPSWESQWGPGRPGWHIECSVMATLAFKKSEIDIHSGGVDLKFPHHDNELAQSEAYFNSESKTSWIKYFLHAGHLSIAGAKMSKSLKNFTTIKTALESKQFTARSLRLAFLLGTWSSGIEITDNLIQNTTNIEDKLNNFFLKARDAERHAKEVNSDGTYPSDEPLTEALSKAKQALDDALCDSFNTPLALQTISDLITGYNSTAAVSSHTTLEIARWITRIVTLLGLDIETNNFEDGHIGWSGIDIPAEAMPYVYPVSELRDQVRKQARAKAIDYDAIAQLADSTKPNSDASSDTSKPYASALENFISGVKQLAEHKAGAKDLLSLCDALRDISLWDLGIYLEDREDLPAMVRPLDQSLITARNEKEAAAKAKAEAKAKREAEEAEKKRLLAEKAKINPVEMFRTAEFWEWDEQGIPVKESDGKEVSKAKRKKMVKEWEKQKKVHEEWLKSGGEGIAS